MTYKARHFKHFFKREGKLGNNHNIILQIRTNTSKVLAFPLRLRTRN